MGDTSTGAIIAPSISSQPAKNVPSELLPGHVSGPENPVALSASFMRAQCPSMAMLGGLMSRTSQATALMSSTALRMWTNSRVRDAIAGYALLAMSVDTDAANGDLRIVRNGLDRHNRDTERINAECIVEMQRIYDFGDVQHKVQPLAAVFALGKAGAVQPKKPDRSSQEFRVVARLGARRQVDIHTQNRSIMAAVNIFQPQENAVRRRRL